jgi:GH24 family phage-related lysozyme (muramidase)
MTSTLPRVFAQTRSAYPSVDSLTPARRTALVSLVYNRGPRLSDRDAVRQDRREMRAIRDLLAAGDEAAVADQFDEMARLWNPAELSRLVERRHNEARLWRSGFASLLLD